MTSDVITSDAMTPDLTINTTTHVTQGSRPPADGYNDLYMMEFTALENFHVMWLELHGYVCLLVCVLGILGNVVNITVLMGRDMRTATNYQLTFLALGE